MGGGVENLIETSEKGEMSVARKSSEDVEMKGETDLVESSETDEIEGGEADLTESLETGEGKQVWLRAHSVTVEMVGEVRQIRRWLQ
jgi:hypothetical protein